MKALIHDLSATVSQIGPESELSAVRPILEAAINLLETNTSQVLLMGKRDLSEALAVATPFLALCGVVIAGALLVRSALLARTISGESGFATAKIATARFFMTNIMPEALAQSGMVGGGGASTLAFPLDAF